MSFLQLDESKAYGEMVEELTDKNLELGERCGELEATIADLESSIELSEELEVQQAEEIRELQVNASDERSALLRQQQTCYDKLHFLVPTCTRDVHL